MKEHPINFNDEMVRAILDGRKTQTRRVIKPQPKIRQIGNSTPYLLGGLGGHFHPHMDCPYGQVGDCLWVREAWGQGFIGGVGDTLIYRENYPDFDKGFLLDGKWKPSVHMKREDSRITLEITGIRVERLQDISEEDAIAEGVHPDTAQYQSDLSDWSFNILGEFIGIWDSINAKKNPWDSNPWVWVITFKPLIDNV